MSKRNFYAVADGHEPGIYETWEECQKQISGYSGAIYKKFKLKVEAEKYIEKKEEEIEKEIALNIEDYDLEVEKDLKDGKVVAFTDGSYSGGDNPTSGYGCFIITPEGEEQEISNKVHTSKYIETNNIAPEVIGVLESLKWALSNEYKTITIYHDLDLIGKWANGTNKARSEIAQLFLRELNNKYKIALDIEFKWVPGHSGVEQNDKADILAKSAVLKQKPVSKYGKNSFMGRGVDKEKVDSIIDEFKNYPDITHSLSEDNNDKERHVLKFNNEKLTVSYFNNTGTTLLQGKVESLFSEFLSKYTLHIKDFDMIKAYSDTFKETIHDKQIERNIRSYSLPNDYPEDIVTLLKQSHVFLNLDRKEYDYSHYPMPAFRALEGHFRYLASKEGVIFPSYQNIGKFFYFCNKDGYPKWKDHNTDSDTIKLAESNVCDKLQDIQIFLTMNRNPLAHFSNIGSDIDVRTKMIESVGEARGYIRGAIDLIVD